jgi:hypothetical protein
MLVSILALALAMATTGSARAQWGVPATSGPFGVGFGTGIGYGVSPFDYGAFAGAGDGGLDWIGTFPFPGYDVSIGRIPQTTTSSQSISDVITTVPGWNRSVARVRRRHSARRSWATGRAPGARR